MKNRIDSSRKKTPWDNIDDKTILQEFISKKYRDNYEKKHPKIKETDEIEFINNIVVTKCKHCLSTDIIKRGKNQNGIQIYYCRKCNKRFNPITNTIFDGHKIPITEWIEFLLDIFNYGSLTLTSRVNKNSVNTTTIWIHKTFLILKEYQKNIVLIGDIYMDEMFYKVRKNEIKKKENGLEISGLSKNQYSIGIGYDGTNVVAIVEGKGKQSKEVIYNTFCNHIQEGSKLIHDGDRSHKKLIKELNLDDESYNSLINKLTPDNENPLRPINHQCDLIRQFLNAHSGFDRGDLQDYLNLYCFMNSGNIKSRNKLLKVEKFLELALSTNIKLRYRDFFEQKGK